MKRKSVSKFLLVLSVLALLSAGDASTRIQSHRVDDKNKIAKWAEKKLFVAKDSTEATVKFDQRVEINSERKPSQTKILNAIDKQLWHLFGPLSELEMYAAPKNDHQITALGEPEKKSPGVWTVDYSYQGTLQVKNGKAKDFKLILPINPENIFARAVETSGNKCTDHHYDGEGDFWYFWNPYKDGTGCKLEQDVDYVEFTPQSVARLPNTKKTYPDYGRTVDEDGVIRIHILMGLDEPQESAKNRNPIESKDINATTYREIRNKLVKQLGFVPQKTNPNEAKQTHWTQAQIEEVAPIELSYLPYVETLTKEINREIKKGNKKKFIKRIETRLFFGPSGIGEDDNGAFHFFYKDALEKAAFVIYDGHSGLGGHLDLDSINQSLRDYGGKPIKFNPKKYQAYFFNSCTSYTYYNLAYFDAKGGTENLDILVNGLATSFYVLQETNVALIRAISNWAEGTTPVNTYQGLAKIIDSSNLFSVNGDEDNPKKQSDLWL